MNWHFAYDVSLDPPAPVLPLRLMRPGGDDRAIVISALVDSGADCTLVPVRVAEHLGLPAISRVALEGVGGAAGSARVHAAQVELPGLRALVQVVAHGHEALIGRDILARLSIRLDGPAGALIVLSTRRKRAGEARER